MVVLSLWVRILRYVNLATLTLVVACVPAWPVHAEQPSLLDEWRRQAAETRKLRQEGKLAEAGVAARKKLAIERQLFGTNHEIVAGTLQWLAEIDEEQEDFPAARQARLEVLAIEVQLHGDQHWQTGSARVALAGLEKLAALSPAERRRLVEAGKENQHVVQLFKEGKYAQAIPLAKQVVQVRHELLGQSHPQYGDSLSNLASLYKALAHYSQAEPLYQQVTELSRRTWGENHPEHAINLNNLAILYMAMGKYADAEPLLQKTLQIDKEALGEKHPYYSNSLESLASLYKAMGRYTQAEPLYQEALARHREVLGGKHPSYATDLNNLAALYVAMGRYAQAEPLYQEALAIRRGVLGREHPDYANTLNNLAALYEFTGAYARAEPLYQEALEINRKVRGDKHPSTIADLNNLGLLYVSMGAPSRAEPLLRKALQNTREVLGEKHRDYAMGLENLAALYQATGAYAEAEPLAKKALEINRAALGEKHPDYAHNLNQLAWLYKTMGRFTEAKLLYQKALAIRREVLGPEHPEYADSVNNLAGLSLAMGDYAQAESLYEKSLAIRRDALGVKHPNYADSLINLSAVYVLTGAYARAEPLLHEALLIQEDFLQDTFSVLGERQRLGFLYTLRGALDAYLQVAVHVPVPADRPYNHLLHWKGAVASQQGVDRVARRQPALQPLVSELSETRLHLARLAFAVPAPGERAAWLRNIDDLRSRKEELESRLAKRSAEFRLARARVEADDVARVLPKEAVLVDFLEYTRTRPGAEGHGLLRQDRRLIAFVLRHGQKPVLVSLGSASAVGGAVTYWRDAQRYQRMPALRAAARELAEQVWRPLLPYVAGAPVLLVSPDGALCQFPLAALPGQRPDSYLIEEAALAHLTSGRQLVEIFAEAPRPPSGGLLAIGGVDYEADPGQRKPASSANDHAGGGKRAGFAPLPGTEAEAQHIVDVYRKSCPQERPPLLLTGAQPTAGRLQAELTAVPGKQRWRYLHLATHGFFAPPTAIAALRTQGSDASPLSPPTEHEQQILGRNPLLFSGLVLAGGEGGVLTAEEVASLDVRGLDLAVLSACETGLGEVASGEGLLGLQRAFQAAGARALLTSLWKVDDAATSLLMEEFYTNLWSKKLSRLEALRQAQLTVLHHPERIEQWRPPGARDRGSKASSEPGPAARSGRRSPPGLWAAFILSGDFR